MARSRPHPIDDAARLAPALLLLALSPSVAVAQLAQGANAPSDEIILPYVTDATLLVARLETAKADLKPVEELAVKALNASGMPPQMAAQAAPQVREGITRARQWLDDMAKAGAARIYVVADVADFSDAGPVVVVPLGPGAKSVQIRSLLNTGKPDQAEADPNANNGGQADPFGGDSRRQRATEVSRAVVWGTAGQVDRVRKQVEGGGAKPDERAGLLDALRASGGGEDVVARIALVPGEAARQWLENSLPALPEQVGGGETRLLSRGVTWAGVAVRQKPEMTAVVTIQARDADTAKALVEKMNKGKEYVQQQMQQKGPPGAATWAKQMAELKPEAKDNRVTMTLPPDLVVLPFFAARGAAVQAQPTPAPGVQPGQGDKGGL